MKHRKRNETKTNINETIKHLYETQKTRQRNTIEAKKYKRKNETHKRSKHVKTTNTQRNEKLRRNDEIHEE